MTIASNNIIDATIQSSILVHDLKHLAYGDALLIQEQTHEQVSSGQIPHTLLFVEHPPVFTAGKRTLDFERPQDGTAVIDVNRGGKITWHGPGQIVGYPIFDLDLFFNDVHKYVRLLEESVIQTLEHYNITGYREAGYTGVWIYRGNEKRKICAIGVHLSRWISLHGFAFNINTNHPKISYNFSL